MQTLAGLYRCAVGFELLQAELAQATMYISPRSCLELAAVQLQTLWVHRRWRRAG